MNLLKLLQQALGDEFVDRSANTIGLSAEQTATAISQLLPVFLGFFSQRTSSPDTAQRFLKCLREHEPGQESESAEDLQKLCGRDLSSLQQGFAAVSELSNEQSKQLLTLATPLIRDSLKEAISESNVGADDLSDYLHKQVLRLKNPLNLALPEADLAKFSEKVSDVTSSAVEGGSEAVTAVTKGLASAAEVVAEAATNAKSTAENVASEVAERISGQDDDAESEVLSAETYPSELPTARLEPEIIRDGDTLTTLQIVEDTGAINEATVSTLAEAKATHPANEADAVSQAEAAMAAARSTVAAAGTGAFNQAGKVEMPDIARTAGAVMGEAAAKTFDPQPAEEVVTARTASGPAWLKYVIGGALILVVLWQVSS